MSDKKLNLYQKINEIQKLVTTVKKGATIMMNKNSSYAAVTHDDVTELIQGPVAEIGLVFFPSITDSELIQFEVTKEWNGTTTKSLQYLIKLYIDVKVVNSDNPEEFEIMKTFSYALDPQDKAQGKALSMGVKNVYLKLFLIKSGDKEEDRQEGTFSYGDNSYKPHNSPSEPSGHLTGANAALPSEKQLNAMYYKVNDNACSLDDFNNVLKPNASIAQYKWLMDDFNKGNFDKLIIKLKE